MSEITIHPFEDKFLDGYYAVRSLTYNNGDAIPQERRTSETPGFKRFVAVQNGDVCGTSTVLEMTASRGPAILPCGGVAGVAVLPELRKSGIGSTMMSWLVRHFRESGVPLASLYAFREPFYRRFGYEVVGRRTKITCPTHRWPKLDCDLPVRRLTPADWEQLVDCYTAFAERRSGLNLRTEAQWQRVLGENRQLTIYGIGEPIEAYAVVSHQSTFWSTDHISEIAWQSKRGYEGLLATLGGLAINKSALSWHEPSDGIFYDSFLDEGIEVKLERPIMFRVNDVPGSLRLLKPDVSLAGEFSLSVADSVIPENEGPWQVSYKDGVVSVEKKSANKGVGLQMSIQAFAQAFLGEPGLGRIAMQERVAVSDASQLKAAEMLLPAQSTYCMDFF